ncbi:hypothetical protein AcW1_001358 [Taiwanofungus camphoratus]|nr:hypothetical protein AcW1_001358 [Antrodia cinnamomea]
MFGALSRRERRCPKRSGNIGSRDRPRWRLGLFYRTANSNSHKVPIYEEKLACFNTFSAFGSLIACTGSYENKEFMWFFRWQHCSHDTSHDAEYYETDTLHWAEHRPWTS